MRATKEKTVSIRLLPADYDKLEAQARRRFTKAASIGSVIITQRVRALSHPAIDFQETPDGGACARLAGRRVAVWLVVEEARRRGQRKAAETLNLPAPMVVAALNYAAEYPEEIADDARRGHRPLKACGLEVPA